MESSRLVVDIDYVGSSGVVLSPEQKAALQTSLIILKSNSKFNKVYFWGKILGIKDDYFIAQGVSSDELKEKKTLYSKNCTDWGLLPPATKEMIEKSKLCKGRFTGDPSYEFEHVEVKKVGEGDEVHDEEETIMIKEEDRLVAVVAQIDEDAAIVPRGAFIKTPKGSVNQNRSFGGLAVAEAAKLCNYFHFRQPKIMTEKAMIQRANVDKSIDFLDAIEDDIPKGSWSLQFDRGSGLVLLRSLLWPGYTFYHVPGTCSYGSVYSGTGEINKDLPFML